jgi:hypothetical protein
MTNGTPALIEAAYRCVRVAWRPKYRYVKCGVIRDDLRAAALENMAAIPIARRTAIPAR